MIYNTLESNKLCEAQTSSLSKNVFGVGSFSENSWLVSIIVFNAGHKKLYNSIVDLYLFIIVSLFIWIKFISISTLIFTEITTE